MPNSTIVYIASMTPKTIGGCAIETVALDEYVQTDLEYLKLLRGGPVPTLLAVVGVQSHQFNRSLDLAAYARANGVEHAIIGGPHPMTCDTSCFHGSGVSFALAEAETIWSSILMDAIDGELRPVYGREHRWQAELSPPPLEPPPLRELKRYVVPMVGVYPARGCPFTCNFCSVIKIAGRQIRSQDVETTMASLRAIRQAGVRLVMFTSDNFNKYAQATELLERMIEEKINIPFFVQCDTQVARQPEFVELLGRAGCFQMFIGVESFHRKTLLAAHKAQNHPETYGEIVRLCRANRIASHFSNIIGFLGTSAADIREHSDILRSLDPDIASFYILTPIPGTEQYGDFLEQGLITERNMDRYDATNTTFAHDLLAPLELTDLLFECYRKFYTVGRALRLGARNMWKKNVWDELIPHAAYPMFSRYCAWRRMHPMSGGIARVIRDEVADYLPFRRSRYGVDLAPLPLNLELSPADAEMNRRVKLAL
ncbi:MAG TPA: radical SAM protein [Terriglobia bacterium]|nr:radical SAM protein [Terriglobia bacterium]